MPSPDSSAPQRNQPETGLSDLHIDEFYADAAKILVNLFRVFPRPVTLFAEDICGTDTPDEYGVHSKRFQACFATMLWLGEEGYLRFHDKIKAEAIDQVVLTGPCFSALLSPTNRPENTTDIPLSVQIQQGTLVFRLAQALHSGSSTQIAADFRTLLEVMSPPPKPAG